ncbi:MAG: DUF2802 domain-containing protein [Sulfuricella sp.]|nr:DUF2802 domain-containing protein [Sulfuricella sp.]
MEGIVITWRELLIVVILISAVYVAEVLLLTRNGGRFGKNGDDKRSRELQSLELDMTHLHERIEYLTVEVEKLKNGQASSVRPYGEAVKLADNGMDVEQLAAHCGISRGEAELIIAVNRLSHQKS